MLLLIVGASARAAAESAGRAGYVVRAIDLFNDRDLQTVCVESARVDSLNDAALIAETFPVSSFIYTGCLENCPELIQRISATHRLLGNAPKVIARIRDPFWVQRVAEAQGFRFAASLAVPVLGDGSSWLRKPLLSGAGIGTAMIADEIKTDLVQSEAGFYYQQFIQGQAISANFVADQQQTHFLGMNQIITSGDLELHPTNRFAFRGNFGPLKMDSEISAEFLKIGRALASAAGLVGLFGIDAILTDDEQVTVIEINPRYTASMELIDRSRSISCIDLNVRVCQGEILTDSSIGYCVGSPHPFLKLIHYQHDAPELLFDENFLQRLQQILGDNDRVSIADIPGLGTKIKRGEPICTLLIRGSTMAECLDWIKPLLHKTNSVQE
jgi:predicted ATP-grasp superfamily ATP-dependent carboligase